MSSIDPFGINPSERLNPSFTLDDEEAGVPEELKPIVMGPPGYASPDPRTSMAALLPLEEHPLSADISPDFGADVAGVHAGVDEDFRSSQSMGEGAAELPADREEWTKKQWQQHARSLGISTSGSIDTLSQRVEAYEEELEADKSMTATDWKDAIENANAEELASVRERYELAGADFSTVDQAFEKRQAELNDEQ